MWWRRRWPDWASLTVLVFAASLLPHPAVAPSGPAAAGSVTSGAPIQPVNDGQRSDTVVATGAETTTHMFTARHGNPGRDLTTVALAPAGTSASDVTPVCEGDGGRSTRGPTVPPEIAYDRPPGDVTAAASANTAADTSAATSSAGGLQLVTGVDNHAGAAEMRDLTVATAHTYYVLAGDTPVLVHNTNCPLSGFKNGVSEDEILAANRDFGGSGVRPGATGPRDALINAGRQSGFYPKLASLIRNITGDHMFDNGNKRTAHWVASQLLERNNIAYGPSSDELWNIISTVSKPGGSSLSIDEIADMLRGYS